MSRALIGATLLACALLEALGDYLMRRGLRGGDWFFCVPAAVSLIGYGMLMNKAPWDFSKLIGVYVVLFFVVGQIIAAFDKQTAFSPALWIGGGFIVMGGVIIACKA